MLNIDLRSVILLASIMSMLMAGVIFLLRRSFSPSIQGLTGWAQGSVLSFAAALLIATRGKLPDFFSLTLANLLLLTGLVYMYLSMRRLLGLAAVVRPWLWLGLAVTPVLVWFAHVEPSYVIFRALIGLLMVVLFLSMVRLLWREGGATMPARLMLTVLLMHTAVIVGSAAYHWVAPSAGQGLLEAQPIQTLYVLSYACTFLLLNIGFILMASDRMRSQLENSIAEYTQSERELQRHRDHLQDMVQEQTVDLIQAKEAAEAVSRTKSEFLASMSHELRTPLNAVLGHAQLLDLDTTLPANVKEQVGEIERAGRHLLALVNDLIDLARIEAGKISLALEPVNIQSLFRDSLGMVRPAADQHGITLIVDADVADTMAVKADSARLCQVMINLLSNAIKYNRPQGQVQLACRVNDGKLRVAVADTGAGIPLELQNRLFTAFDRLGKELSTTEGTGIGLIISKRLIEAMGGTMGFASRPGQGSTFWLELPVAPA